MSRFHGIEKRILYGNFVSPMEKRKLSEEQKAHQREYRREVNKMLNKVPMLKLMDPQRRYDS